MPINDTIARLRKSLGSGGFLALGATSLFCALCAAHIRGSARGLNFRHLSYVLGLNWIIFFGVTAACAAALLALCWVFENPRLLGAALPASAFCFAMFAACDAESDIFFSLGLCLPLFLALRWACKEENAPFGQPLLPMWTTHALAILLFLAFTLVIGYFSILRYRIYSATNFDLGIFAQMFEFLRRTGHAWTTLERNRLLTHFGVHCSPIYYLVLPIYMLVPRIETLLVVQAAVVGAGVFAVRGIAQQLFGKSPRLIALSCLLFFFNPSFSNGCLFDFHENKFLTVLLLYAVYFILKRKALPLLIFSALILMVKEDAAIYVVTLALYLLVTQRWEGRKENLRRIITSIAMILGSVVWFLIAMAIIKHYGSGVMVERLHNYFLTPAGGFGEIFLVMLSNLGYVIKEVFTQEKLKFLLWLFLPLGFAPFLRKRGADWLLLLPLLVINLLSNYGYQHLIGYQYTFGSFALALVLALLALRNCGPRLRRQVLLFAVMASVLVTVPSLAPRMANYRDTWTINTERIRSVDRVLAALPEDAEVTATTWFAVHLYKRDNVYMYPNFYDTPKVTEYLLCKPEEPDTSDAMRVFIEENYELKEEVAFVQVYVKRDKQEPIAEP